MFSPHSTEPRPFQTLAPYLNTYLTQDAPDPTLPAPDTALPKASDMMKDADFCTDLLARVLPAFQAMSTRLRRRRRQAAGGKANHNRFSRRDLTLNWYTQDELRHRTIGGYCAQIGNDVRLAVRLACAAARAYQNHKECWQERHEGLAVALGRIWQAALSADFPSERVGEILLRWNLRKLWKDLFGPGVPMPQELRGHLAPLRVPRSQIELLTRQLEWERYHDVPTPPPFVRLLALRDRGRPFTSVLHVRWKF